MGNIKKMTKDYKIEKERTSDLGRSLNWPTWEFEKKTLGSSI